MAPKTWERFFPLLLAALAVALGPPVPVVDEEQWMDLGRQIAGGSGLYGWWRPMPPWGSTPASAYPFAHPPLFLAWLGACTSLFGSGTLLRVAVTAPFALLYGQAAVVLQRRLGGHLPALLASPVLLLALEAGFMPDLAVAALGAAAVAAHVEGRPTLAGVLLGAAACTKYPALLLILVIGRDWRTLLSFFLVFGGVELASALVWGQPHLLAVLGGAGEIARGPVEGRAAGILLRAGLLASPLLAWRRWIGAGIGGAVGLLAAGPGGVPFGAAGGAVLEALIREGGLLSRWALVVLLGVLGHNYAGGRYLLPAALPVALTLSRKGAPAWAILPFGALAAACTWAEREQAIAAAELDAEVDRFSGEWSFRWSFASHSRWWAPPEALPSGARVAVAVNSVPSPLPPEWLLVEERWSPRRFPLRLLDAEAGIGYHAETLGPLPLGWSTGPLEGVRVYEVP